MKLKSIIVICIILISCNKSHYLNYSEKVESHLKLLLSQPKNYDSIEYSCYVDTTNRKTFLYFKSGKFLNNKDRNAIIVKFNTDSTFMLTLKKYENNKWRNLDSLSNIEVNLVQFDIQFKDYNFDNQNDIYIQTSASNGFSVSRGRLITINPINQKLESHKETNDFGNMSIDKNNKIINSEIWEGYNMNNEIELKTLTHKWIDNKLITIDTLKQFLNQAP